jgi:4-amino-4-deoxy-L-arabinose transferase-like glycosyltransferase
MRLTGCDNRVWVVRLPSGLMGLIVVMLTMRMAGRFLGRDIGLLAGLVLATSFEFYSYACLAEDDIYLGALVAGAAALFCSTGVPPVPCTSPHGRDARAATFRWFDLFTLRSPAILGFFVVLGLTNLTKGPLLGLVILGSPVGVFLIWESVSTRSRQPILRFTWLWGWLVMIAMTIAWPMWAYHNYPDVVDNWKYDYLGRVSGTYSDINEAWYYYLPTIAISLLPWTPACLVGVLATARQALVREQGKRSSFDVQVSWFLRFIWCWAIIPLLVLSIPKGKHHHYLIPLIAPWAILGAIGVREIGRFLFKNPKPAGWRSPLLGMLVVGLPGAMAIVALHGRIPEPIAVTIALGIFWMAVVGCFLFAIRHRRGRLLMGTCVVALLVGFSWTQTMIAGGTDHTPDDTAFLLRASREVPASLPLLINAKLGPAGNLDFFRCQFYSRKDARLLHNLSFLRDDQLTSRVVYVITRARDEAKLKQLGGVALIDQSPLSHDMPRPEGRLSLFRLSFDPNLVRYTLPVHITSLQAMERADGPWCGPRM